MARSKLLQPETQGVSPRVSGSDAPSGDFFALCQKAGGEVCTGSRDCVDVARRETGLEISGGTMSITGLKKKKAHAERRWQKHQHTCKACASARSAATLCECGQKCWFDLARIEIDIERSEASAKGISYALHMAGGAR